MYAIVRKGNGQYYTSKVFAYFNTTRDRWDYNHRYWVVLNEEKTKLVNHPVCRGKDIKPLILAVDSDQSDWDLVDDDCQFVRGLPGFQLYEMIENDSVPEELLARCIEEDGRIIYDEYPYILTEKSCVDLDWVFGGFHDSYIKETRELDDELYVYFEGMWGCDLEVWFEGEISYDIESRNPQYYDPYWMGGKVFFFDGYVCLIDDDDPDLKEIKDGWCWFKARKMKYHVIPC